MNLVSIKNRFQNKTVKWAVVMTLLVPPQAHCVVALLKQHNTGAVTGGVVVGVGASVSATGAIVANTIVASTTHGGVAAATAAAIYGALPALTGAVVAAIGVVILDHNDVHKISYSSITYEDGAKLSLTQAEVESFNQNLEILNAIYDEILAASFHIEAFDEHIAGEMWVDALNELGISSETRSALLKVTTHAIQELSR